MRKPNRKNSGHSRSDVTGGIRWEEIECDALELYLGIARLMSHLQEQHRPPDLHAPRPHKKRP